MRLIDADALLEIINNENYSDYQTYSDIFDAIETAPTIEAEPVRRGRMIELLKHGTGGLTMADIITIEECITRLDAIRHEIVSNSRDHFALSAGIAALYEMEKNAPAVNRWIPCRERMPEVETRVLLAHENRDIMIGELCDIKIFDTDNGFVKLEDITHWMPLPEPFEKE